MLANMKGIRNTPPLLRQPLRTRLTPSFFFLPGLALVWRVLVCTDMFYLIFSAKRSTALAKAAAIAGSFAECPP
jgi:hypothetical protein